MGVDVLNTTNWGQILHPYEQAVKELVVKFLNVKEEYKVMGAYSPIESVTGRVKKVSSILDKASRKKIPGDRITREIEDIAGIRILCQFVEDIQRIIEHIRSRKDMKILEERDYINNTKPSGYRSYHVIISYPLNTASGYIEIPAEIQIRTLSMNFWAAAEHSLRYKYSGNIPKKLQDRLKNCAEAAFNLDNEMTTIREEIMHAQRLNEIRDNLVSDILEKIQSLYFVAKLEEMDRLNREFMDLWEEGNVSKLEDFKEQLDMMEELYSI